MAFYTQPTSLYSTNLGQLVSYGAQSTYVFEQLEANINQLPAGIVLQCLNHHTFFGGLAPLNGVNGDFSGGGADIPVISDQATAGLQQQKLQDCLLAQYANNEFMFALFDSFGKLLHIYDNKMFTSRRSDGSLLLMGMKDTLNPSTVQETQLNDPWQIYLFNTFEKADHFIIGPGVTESKEVPGVTESKEGPRVTKSKDGKPSQFYRRKFNLGENKTLLTTSVLLMNGPLHIGTITGLSVNKEYYID